MRLPDDGIYVVPFIKVKLCKGTILNSSTAIELIKSGDASKSFLLIIQKSQ